MMPDDRIDSLLDVWQDHLNAGQELPVAELCRDCPELIPEVTRRAELLRKVLNLAATLPAPADAVTRSASDATRTASDSPAASSDLPAAPPGYVIDSEIARGGMGVVYRARQTGLNREVAIKTLLGASDSRGLIRFLAEAEAVAAVRHPNVVGVFDFGQHAGRPFLVMEYLPGGTLKDRLEAAGKLTPRAAAELVGKVAAGVAAAHEQGIVHRDLKPGNVLFDGSGEPKVADFGLAKRGSGSDLTRTQAVMGIQKPDCTYFAHTINTTKCVLSLQMWPPRPS